MGLKQMYNYVHVVDSLLNFGTPSYSLITFFLSLNILFLGYICLSILCFSLFCFFGLFFINHFI